MPFFGNPEEIHTRMPVNLHGLPQRNSLNCVSLAIPTLD